MSQTNLDKQITIEGRIYTLGELVNSTLNRANYNMDLSMEALLDHDDIAESERLANNAKMMISDVKYAMENNDPEWLADNRDW